MTEEKKNTRSKKYKIEEQEIIVEEEIEEEPKSPSIIFKVIIILLILIATIFIYSFFICPKIFKTNEYKIESNLIPESFNGIKIVQFSDIHYGTTINKKQLDTIVKNINTLKPDIILFTGDLIDKNISPTEDIKNEIIESLKALNATLYKYAVYGNEDKEEIFDNIMNSIDFIILKNNAHLLYYHGTTPIEVFGFTPASTNPDYSIIGNSIDEIDPNSVYKIIIMHEPNPIDKMLSYNPNLIISGSTLGGIIKLPLIKPLILNEYNNKYYKAHYSINETEAYISNGLGTTDINARFNNNPSINFYRLYHTN